MRVWTRIIAAGLGCLFLTASTSHGATIYACKKKIGGTIRIVGAKTVCLATEVKMSWNSEGPQGEPGLDGATILNGTADPTTAIGKDGDFFLNTTTNIIFGPKTSGVWSAGVSLVGPQGDPGEPGLQGPPGTLIISSVDEEGRWITPPTGTIT